MTAALDHRFGPFDGGVWLNCAHQGPLPHPARDAALVRGEGQDGTSGDDR